MSLLKNLPRNVLKSAKTKAAFKTVGYTAVAILLMAGVAYANLDEQVDKAHALVLGKVSKLVLGGAVAFGAGKAAIAGNMMLAAAIIGTAIIAGITISMTSDGMILKIL